MERLTLIDERNEPESFWPALYSVRDFQFLLVSARTACAETLRLRRDLL